MNDLSRERRLFEILEHASTLKPDDISAYLDKTCENDPELRSKAERLLQQADSTSISNVVFGPQKTTNLTLETEIGPFKLLEEIGHGGMGSVHLAIDKRLNRKVAIKFIRFGRFATTSERHRFEIEKKSLSNLSHPYIVTIFHAGFMDENQPYFIMEYIEGKSLTAYCNSQQLSIHAKIELFIQVAQAVQYAHDNLIVHRDLKPANILVQESGIPKLLDFGIAKLLDAPEEKVTATGLGIMTPEYAAPEQIEGTAITTSIDVFALGVILYELLTEVHPFKVNNSSRHELIHSILKKSPPRPSDAISKVSKEDSSIGIHRSKTVQLKRRLQGDLDTITLKALHKDPSRRYRSVQSFIDDLQRYLDGRTVQARSDTLTYRIGKFVNRHPAGVTSTVFALAFILALVSAYVINISQARDEAEQALQRSERVAAFTVSLLQPADPNEAQGDTLTVFQVLERSSEQLQNELLDEPELRSELSDLIGEIYSGLGDYERATPLLEQAIDIRRGWKQERPEELSESLIKLAKTKVLSGQPDSAVIYTNEALQLLETESNNELSLGEVYDVLGKIASSKSKYSESASYHRLAISHFENVSDEDQLEQAKQGLAANLNNLGVALYASQDDLEEAEEVLIRSLTIYEEILGDKLHTDLIAIQNSLGEINRRSQRFNKAVYHYKESLTLARELLGPHPLTGIIASNLAVGLRALGCNEEQRTYLEESLSIKESTLPPNHYSTGITYHNLGAYVMNCREDMPEAIKFLEKARTILKVGLSENHLYRGNNLHQLGEAYRAVNDYKHSLPLSLEALSIRQFSLKPPHNDLGLTYSSIGFQYQAMQQPDSAVANFNRAITQFINVAVLDSVSIVDALDGLNTTIKKWGLCSELIPMIDKQLEDIKQYGIDTISKDLDISRNLNTCSLD
ncbi:MAG: serine/threonine-protein kinase [Rhodothermaceae bacterium]|nr:serine/threonine-protein kinase [Rhodothermaceae bacterium]